MKDAPKAPGFARNALFNLLGSVLPLAVALVTVPIYLHRIGDARYGVLVTVWMLQGYFGFFDLGLTRATSNQVARMGGAPHAERESLLWTAVVLNAAFGVLGGFVLYGVAGLALGHVFHMDASIRAEVIPALPFIACAVPMATLTGVFSGALEGIERFGPLNAVQFVGMLLYQTLPLAAALLFGPQLEHLILAAMVGSTLTLLLLAATVARVFPLRGAGGPARRHVRPLFGFGMWVTLTNLVSPLLEAADRFLIGSVISANAVAYYTVPFNLATRLRLIPAVLCRTLFPRLSALATEHSSALAERAITGLAALITPVVVVGMLAMQPFLRLWVGAAFAAHASLVGEVLLAGVWINSLAHVAFDKLQAQGRPDVVARLHVVELGPFIALLWGAMHAFGLVGAAFAWSVRCAVDGVVLMWLAGYRGAFWRRLVAPVLTLAATFALIAAGGWPTWTATPAALLLVAVACVWAWRTEPLIADGVRRFAARLSRRTALRRTS